jgi:hypothetical protein
MQAAYCGELPKGLVGDVGVDGAVGELPKPGLLEVPEFPPKVELPFPPKVELPFPPTPVDVPLVPVDPVGCIPFWPPRPPAPRSWLGSYTNSHLL